MVTKKGRKISGGRYKQERKKKKYEIAGQKIIVKLSKDNDKRRTIRTRGGNIKTFMLKGKFINVRVKDKPVKIQKIEIKNVLETPSNRFLARQNIITKGTIVETDIGKVRVTNRPTQQAVINGILISEKA